MTAAVYDWVRSIIYYMIFLSVAENLLADSIYKKYMSFFAGMVLMLLVIRPLTGGIQADEMIAGLSRSISLEQDTLELKEDLLGMDEKRLGQIAGSYEQAMEEDIRQLARFQGMECGQVQVTVDRNRDSEDYGRVMSVFMTVGEGRSQNGDPKEGGSQNGDSEEGRSQAGDSGEGTGESGNSLDVLEIQPVEAVEVGKVSRGEQSKEAVETEGDLREAVRDLKGKVAWYYELEESCIEIQWKDE